MYVKKNPRLLISIPPKQNGATSFAICRCTHQIYTDYTFDL